MNFLEGIYIYICIYIYIFFSKYGATKRDEVAEAPRPFKKKNKAKPPVTKLVTFPQVSS